MDELLELHRRALDEFGRRVHAVGAEQWDQPTPCTEWTVRKLVEHLVVEQLWVPPLVAGKTIAEVGDQFDGDQLGDDPVGRWDAASAAAWDAFARDGALDSTVHLSYGDRPARGYLQEMLFDAVVHSWDLARGIGADERLEPELVRVAYETAAPVADQWQNIGIFAPAVSVPEDADQQTRLLALTGRRA